MVYNHLWLYLLSNGFKNMSCKLQGSYLIVSAIHWQVILNYVLKRASLVFFNLLLGCNRISACYSHEKILLWSFMVYIYLRRGGSKIIYPAGRIYSKMFSTIFVWACDSSVTATCMPDRLLLVISITHRPISTAESSTRLSYRGTSWLVVTMLYNRDSKKGQAGLPDIYRFIHD